MLLDLSLRFSYLLYYIGVGVAELLLGNLNLIIYFDTFN